MSYPTEDPNSAFAPSSPVSAETPAPPKRRWRVTFNAPVTLTFVALCTIATVLNYATGGIANDVLFSTYRSSLFDPLTYPRLFMHIFGHAGWDHLVSNMAYILLLGPLLEEKYGGRALLEVMALTAVVTAVANALFFPNVALCGASGVCFAFIILGSITDVAGGEIPLTFILVAVVFIGQQVWQGFTEGGNISYLAHIVGGVVGGFAGFLLARSSNSRAS